MPKIPGVNHLQAVRALEKAGFSIVRQGKKHIGKSDGTRFLTIPRKNPINAHFPQRGPFSPDRRRRLSGEL